jgi:heptosyltransferase-3
LKTNRILISRIDAIGDVTLTLPMCGYLKSVFPSCEIFFLGLTYTQAVIESSSAIDHFIDYNNLSSFSPGEQTAFFKDLSLDVCVNIFPDRHLSFIFKEAGIPSRIGTTNRWFHWFTCNKLVRLSRRRSDLHEAELNLRLLSPLGIGNFPALSELHNYYQFDRFTDLSESILSLLSREKLNLVLHPKSHGSGKEWPLSSYRKLIELLPANKYRILISGSEKEKPLLTDWISSLKSEVVDITGLMSLAELIAFLHVADGLVASSTGPLHLAAASGINALGLYPNTPPLHAGRWGPVGKNAVYIESTDSNLSSISAEQVYSEVTKWRKFRSC